MGADLAEARGLTAQRRIGPPDRTIDANMDG
jgi:hypothetical protein